jgi:hypothetical protein
MDKNTSLEEFFVNIYIPFDCEFLVAQWSAETLKVSVTEIYHLVHTRPLQTFSIANWTSGDGFSWSSVPLFTRRKNLQGITIKGAVISYVRISYVHMYKVITNDVSDYINLLVRNTLIICNRLYIEMVYEVVDGIEVAEDRFRWWGDVKTVKNIQRSQNSLNT